MSEQPGELYGVMAEFDEPGPLIEAARAAYEAGHRQMDAYTPFPVEGLAEALGKPPVRLPLLMLIGGLAGAGGAYFMQWYPSVISMRWNIGGRPMHSWPSFVPITFELMVLAASLVGVLGMIALNHLPRLHHPVFNLPGFRRASRDRFFLCIEEADPRFDAERVEEFLRRFAPRRVRRVYA